MLSTFFSGVFIISTEPAATFPHLPAITALTVTVPVPSIDFVVTTSKSIAASPFSLGTLNTKPAGNLTFFVVVIESSP